MPTIWCRGNNPYRLPQTLGLDSPEPLVKKDMATYSCYLNRRTLDGSKTGYEITLRTGTSAASIALKRALEITGCA
jgi:hypothetical protein